MQGLRTSVISSKASPRFDMYQSWTFLFSFCAKHDGFFSVQLTYYVLNLKQELTPEALRAGRSRSSCHGPQPDSCCHIPIKLLACLLYSRKRSLQPTSYSQEIVKSISRLMRFLSSALQYRPHAFLSPIMQWAFDSITTMTGPGFAARSRVGARPTSPGLVQFTGVPRGYGQRAHERHGQGGWHIQGDTGVSGTPRAPQ